MTIKCMIAKALKILLNPPAIKNCIIDKSSKIGPRSELTSCAIGRYSYIGQQCFMVNTEIGSFCSIADKVSIGGALHPMEYVSTSPVFHKGKNIMKKNFSNHFVPHTKKTIIENDVWIGQGAFVKAGVRIHNGAVVGMGSVVTHDIPAYEIWAGNPAKKIRNRFDDNIIKGLLDLEWWNWTDEMIANNADKFDNPSKLIAEARKNGGK